MPTVTFYRQKRVDSAIRTGVAVDRTTVFMDFEEGDAEDFDNRILWYLDLRFKGESVPDAARDVIPWLLRWEAPIVEALARSAAKDSAGFDPEFAGPVDRFDLGDPGATSVGVFFGANGRFEARESPRIIRDVADHWGERLRGLAPVREVSAH